MIPDSVGEGLCGSVVDARLSPEAGDEGYVMWLFYYIFGFYIIIGIFAFEKGVLHQSGVGLIVAGFDVVGFVDLLFQNFYAFADGRFEVGLCFFTKWSLPGTSRRISQ